MRVLANRGLPETALAALAAPHASGVLVKSRPRRLIYRLRLGEAEVFAKYYPSGGLMDFVRGCLRGGASAKRDYDRLLWLANASVPAPEPLALVQGLVLEGRTWDVVVTRAIPGAMTFEEMLADRFTSGTPTSLAATWCEPTLDLLRRLDAAGLRHRDLHLRNLVVGDGRLYLVDASAVRRGRMRPSDLLFLAHDAEGIPTRTQKLRAWRAFFPLRRPPRRNPVSRALWRIEAQRIGGENQYFGRFTHDGWSCTFTRRATRARPWAACSRRTFSAAEWQAAMPRIIAALDSGAGEALKLDRSSHVVAVDFGGALRIVVKEPFRKTWLRYINEIGRGCRSRRAWRKAWRLVIRDIPTAWPLLLAEKRVAGYVVRNFMVTERIEGEDLALASLTDIDPGMRSDFFHALGRLLARAARRGVHFYDSKSSNWMVWKDAQGRLRPVVIDVDGIRSSSLSGGGMKRLLRSLLGRPGFGPAEKQSLEHGLGPSGRTEEPCR